MRKRHYADNRNTLLLSLSFIGIEEKELVLNYRAAETAAKYVAREARSRSPLLAGLNSAILYKKVIGRVPACSVVKKRVRRKCSGSIEIKQRSVEVIGPTLCDKRDLSSGRSAL